MKLHIEKLLGRVASSLLESKTNNSMLLRGMQLIGLFGLISGCDKDCVAVLFVNECSLSEPVTIELIHNDRLNSAVSVANVSKQPNYHSDHLCRSISQTSDDTLLIRVRQQALEAILVCDLDTVTNLIVRYQPASVARQKHHYAAETELDCSHARLKIEVSNQIVRLQ